MSDNQNDELGSGEIEALKEAVNKVRKTVFDYDNSHTSSLQQVYNGVSQSIPSEYSHVSKTHYRPTNNNYFSFGSSSGKDVSVNISLDTQSMLTELRSTLAHLLYQSNQRLAELSDEYDEVEKEVISLQQKIDDFDILLKTIGDKP